MPKLKTTIAHRTQQVMGMFKTGFDSAIFSKDLSLTLEVPTESTTAPLQNNDAAPEVSQGSQNTINPQIPQPTILKALIGASVTTEDADFDQHYRTVIDNVFKRYGLRQEKPIYKGAHLVRQVGEDFDIIFSDIINDIAGAISHVDLYFATYPKPFVSIFGKGQGKRLTPLEYIEKHQNGFAHACAWWHWKQYSTAEQEYDYYLDHFDSKSTPAWVEMGQNNVNMKVFYSGCECNSLISLADLILKVIQEYHFGGIDYRTLPAPIWKRCRTYSLKKKIHFAFDLSKYDWVIHATVPDSPLNINLTKNIKHPIYFIAWTPTLPRNTVKRSFEWSKLYNAVINKAIDNKGCVKFLDFDNDMTIWEDEDFIVPWEPADQEHVRLLTSMRFSKMPKILNLSDVIT